VNKKGVINGIEYEIGSGNVYADLGHPDAEEMSVKSQLTHIIQKEIEQRNITQAEAGKIIGIDQSDVSRLLKGRLRMFSIERLFQFLNRLGYTVELKVVQERSRKRQAHTYVSAT
jgi:predicted XRE-type DNA-binding protein